ncbi:MAG: phenylacetate--CoA ligase family protein, partial [Candidatus Kariarchaeaceae archaeon]
EGFHHTLQVNVNETIRNMRFLSSFKMREDDLTGYVSFLRRWKPLFLRGYPSALYEFSKYVKDMTIPEIRGIYTTSEKLYPKVRDEIESAFDTKVYDGYGANDGGVSANECEFGNIHIDTERSIMEIVDDDNNQIQKGKGRVLATSLKNYAISY